MIKLLVDSASDFTKAELNNRNIEFIPLGITLDNENYLDGINLTKDDFYDKIQKSTEFPKTSMPSPAAFLEYFEMAKENGDEIVCILLSSALSGTYQSAVTAKGMVDYDKIYIVDSSCVATGIKIIVNYADKLRNDGLSGEEIAQKVESLKSKVRVYAGLDTLEYLYRGGRLSRTSAAIGTVANLKPIVTLDAAGTVSVVKKSLGRTRAMRDLFEIIKKAEIDTDFPIYSLYTCGTDNCEELEKSLCNIGIEYTERSQIGPTIGAHVGPGVYGIFYVEK